MKTLITTLLAIIFSFQASTQNQPKNFRITINTHHLGGSALTIITNDSIVSTHFWFSSNWMNLKQGMNGYPNVVTEAIRKIEIEKLADKYRSSREDAPDDYYEFDFTFEINGKKKKIHIYGGRQEQILEFVKQINEMIPSCFQIPYNEEYLKRFEKKH